ncbi:Nuf2 family protein [Candida albicans]|uniref:Nuf2 family protein n=1 Tax=Candida albicans TaxID=5476 RepID=A0A8H6BSG3_CANAX|nr:Nuf2 family protein [Candida albicans]
MYKTCSYFVKSKNAEIPKSKQKQKQKQKQKIILINVTHSIIYPLIVAMSRQSFYADPSSAGRQMKYRKDLFPLLDTREITACLLECEFNVTQELIVKPTADFVTNLFEQFLDTFMGIPLGTIRKKARKMSRINPLESDQANGKPQQSPEEEFNDNQENDKTKDTFSALQLLTLHRYLAIFFSTCGINDFVLTDIARPDGYRIRRILSAVINFIRFREDQSPKFDHLANECEATADKVSEVQAENKNDEKQVANLTKYAETDLSILVKITEDLSNDLSSMQTNYKNLEKSYQNMGITIDSIQVNEINLKDLLKLAEDITRNVEKRQIEGKILKDNQDNLDELTRKQMELEGQILIVQNQLNKSNKKYQDLIVQADKKESAVKLKLEETKQEFNDILSEKEKHNEEHKRIMDQIVKIQQETTAIQDAFVKESKEVELKLINLMSIIKRYMSDLRNNI